LSLSLPNHQQLAEDIERRAVSDNPRGLGITDVDVAFKIWQALQYGSFDRVGPKLRIDILEGVLGSAGFGNNIGKAIGVGAWVGVAAALGVTLALGLAVPWASKLAAIVTSVSEARKDLGT
jgi:hypothetical protein